MRSKLDEYTLTYFFLYFLECSIPLLGRAILHKLRATTLLTGDKLETDIPLDKGHKMMMLMAEDKPP